MNLGQSHILCFCAKILPYGVKDFSSFHEAGLGRKILSGQGYGLQATEAWCRLSKQKERVIGSCNKLSGPESSRFLHSAPRCPSLRGLCRGTRWLDVPGAAKSDPFQLQAPSGCP